MDRILHLGSFVLVTVYWRSEIPMAGGTIRVLGSGIILFYYLTEARSLFRAIKKAKAKVGSGQTLLV